MKGLDFLKGYDPSSPFNHYDRTTVEVNGVTAHLYVASDTFRDHHVVTLPRLGSGNWLDVSTGDACMWVYPREDYREHLRR